MKFKVGDVVEVVFVIHEFNKAMVGSETVITEVHPDWKWTDFDKSIGIGGCGYRTAINRPGKAFSADQLRLKRPPTKDDSEPRSDFTPGDWSLCPWRPEGVRV